jgi:uncharacterized small protein (DUF1192 family)
MTFEDLEPRPARGANLTALVREDLDPYSVNELNEQIEALGAEIERRRRAIDAKRDKKSAADALFNFR